MCRTCAGHVKKAKRKRRNSCFGGEARSGRGEEAIVSGKVRNLKTKVAFLVPNL